MNAPPSKLMIPGGGDFERVEGERSVVVVGGGIAGVAAATLLSERGFEVTLVEREPYLGGRAGAWTDRLATGESFQMERGFHAFFRQYYNLRAFLRRIDPQLTLLRPLTDYPILGPNNSSHSFADLPRRTPQNVIALTSRTPTIGWRDLLRIDKRQAMKMLSFDTAKSYGRWDDESAEAYLDSLRFPPDARRLLFDVFAHSFFNPEGRMSAAELLMMFHFYFTGNREGLVFDVCDRPFSHAIWDPFEQYLGTRSVKIRKGESAHGIRRNEDDGWTLSTEHDEIRADAAVLALSVPALKDLVSQSPALDDTEWRRSIDELDVTLPFAVWRLWLDGPTRDGRAPFAGTTGMGVLDNISLYHLFEDESRDWATRTNGSVVELHAYAVDAGSTEAELKQDMLQALHQSYPETAALRTLEERFLYLRDCPAFAPGSHARRPEVATPFGNLTLAGDFVRLPFPSALMERAAASGFLAANHLMARVNVSPEPLFTVPLRGMLAGLPLG